MTRSADDLVAEARERISRIAPADVDEVLDAGGLIIDIRPQQLRGEEGAFPGAIVIERNVLEWRLDPQGDHRISQVTGYDQPVIIVCSAGYASSLAAASLTDLGFSSAADLDGGYQAWRAWLDADAVVPLDSDRGHLERVPTNHKR